MINTYDFRNKSNKEKNRSPIIKVSITNQTAKSKLQKKQKKKKKYRIAKNDNEI